MNIKGIIFDMDGVITQTATLHFKAWKIIIEQFLTCIEEQQKSFTENEYFHFLDGMPRKDGLANYFNHIGLLKDQIKGLYKNFEEGIEDLCKQKNNLILQILLEENIKCFQDSLKFIEFLLLHDYKIALISSSKNCIPILKKTHIENMFPIYVDGIIAEEMNLPGKPHPAIFLEAAKRLNLLPEECLIVEDALAGVKAGKEGKFGGVVALDRNNSLCKDFLNLQPDFILPDLFSTQILLYHQLKFPNKSFESAFKVLPFILDLIKKKNQLVIFLDYDGTLTPIVDTPEEAVLSQQMYQSLSDLSQKYLTVIISGREIENLRKVINISHIIYSGNHGFELKGPSEELSYQVGNEFKEEISIVYQHLFKLLKNIPGCILENKKFTLSIHYRLVKDNLHSEISKIINDVLTHYPNLICHYGKKVFEVRPNIQWNKGVASAFILQNLKLKNPNLIPIYIGDDVSDEDAFETFKLSGLTIKVMRDLHFTKAHYFLNSPLEVQNFLNCLNNFKEKE